MSDEQTKTSPGLLAALGRLLRHTVATAQNRAELLAVEFQEEAARLLEMFLLALTAAVFGLLTLIMVTFAVVLAVSDKHRLAVAAAAGIYLIAAAAAAWRLRVKLKTWSAFSATRAELRKDRAWLEDQDSSL